VYVAAGGGSGSALVNNLSLAHAEACSCGSRHVSIDFWCLLVTKYVIFSLFSVAGHP
jgi:hypothetical protein